MGKRKLQGAKLRAKKRSKAQIDELQEQQADEYCANAVKEQAIFFLDTVGDAVPHHQLAPANDKAAAKQRKQDEISEKEQLQVDRLIAKHKGNAQKLQKLAEDGRKILTHRPKGQVALIRRECVKPTRSEAKFDLWSPRTTRSSRFGSLGSSSSTDIRRKSTRSGETDAVVPVAIMQPIKVTAVHDEDLPKPGIGGALAGTHPQHAVVKAKTLAMIELEKASKKELKRKKEEEQRQEKQQDAKSKTKKKKKKKTNSNTTTAVPSTTSTAPVAVDVAEAGQSYHPDPIAHQTLLQKAIEVEVLREQATRKLREPLAKGLSDETKSLLLGDSDSENDDDNDSCNSESDNMAVGPIPKRSNKLTTAQRNKKKRAKSELIAVLKRQQEKKLLKQVSHVPTLKKEIEKAERVAKEKRMAREQLKQKTASNPVVTNTIAGKNIQFKAFAVDPIAAPTIPVVLPSSTKTTTTTTKMSLRTIQPKGCLLTDRIQSFYDRKIVTNRKTKKSTASTKLIVSSKDSPYFVDPITNIVTNSTTTVTKKLPVHSRRKKAYKGKHNQGIKGPGFLIKGM